MRESIRELIQHIRVRVLFSGVGTGAEKKTMQILPSSHIGRMQLLSVLPDVNGGLKTMTETHQIR